VVDGGKGQLAFHNPRYNRPSAQKAKIWRFFVQKVVVVVEWWEKRLEKHRNPGVMQLEIAVFGGFQVDGNVHVATAGFSRHYLKTNKSLPIFKRG